MKVLFITNLLPYPTDNGGKIKTYNTIKILSKYNNIDLMCFYEEDSDLKGKNHLYELCSTIDCIKKPITTSKNLNYMRKMAVKNLISPIPLVAEKFDDDEFRKILNKKIDQTKYDIIYIDHLQLGVYLNDVIHCNAKLVLDEHNAESTIILRKANETSNLAKKAYFNYEHKRLRNFEAKIINSVDEVIVLSQEDKKTLKEISKADDSKFIQIPIPIEINYEKKAGMENKDRYNILFLGTLSWYPNSQGIDWFIKNVVPMLDKNNFKYNLYVVGKDPSEELIQLGKEKENIIVTGFVDDVNEYIEKCDFMVVPLFIGSGMRVKILESMGKNIPVISTTIGCEGIAVKNDESILIADNEEEFVDAINKILDSELYNKLRKNAKELFENNYSVKALERLYSKIINNKGDINERK